MAKVQQIDDNFKVINTNEAILLRQAWTFVTGTTGATGTHTLFTVTGDVIVSIFGVCKTDLTGAGTIEVGIAGNTAAILAQIANATTLDKGENYVDATPETVSVTPGSFILNDGSDILLEIGSTAITAGVVDFYILWRPLSSGASIVVTTPA